MTGDVPTPDMAREVAGKLSEAGRNALLCGLRGYFDPNTIRSLRTKGLLAGGLLTPLGLLVRDILLGDSDNG